MADFSSLLGTAGLGGAIGKAVVQLELDTKKYTAEMNAAKAQTTSSANQMSTGVAKFGGLAKTAFLGAGVAAVAFGAYSVKAAVEAADAQLKLSNTLHNNAMLSDVTKQSFLDQADALRNLTGVDDEAIIVSQAMLGQFKITGQQVQELTPLIVDLSEKMGIDLAAATKSVGKAVIGNTAGLQRYGIVIGEAAGAGGEFEAVVKGLQGTVGGFAKERAIEEPWRVLGAQFEEVAETVGNLLLPAIRGLTKALEPLVGGLKLATENLDVVLTTLLGFAALKFLPTLLLGIAVNMERLGFAAASAQFEGMAYGVSALGTSFLGAAGAAGVFATAFIGLTAALAAWDPLGLVDDTEKLRESMTVTTKAFGDSDVILGRVAVSENLLQHGAEGASQSLDEMKAKAALTNGGITNLSGGFVELSGSVSEATEGLHRYLDATLALTDPTFALIDAVRSDADAEDALAAAHRKLNNLREAGKQGTQAYRDAQDEVRSAALGAAEAQAALFGAVRKFQDEIKTGESTRREAIAAIKDMGKEAGLSGADIRDLVNDVKGGLNAAAAYARAHAPSVGTAIASGIALGVTTHSELVSVAAADAVHDAMQAARDAAKATSPSKVMAELGRDLMRGLANGIDDEDQKVLDAIKRMSDKLLEQAKSDLSKVQGAASGFGGNVRGAFSGFTDLAGGFGDSGLPLSTFLETQTLQAQNFSLILKALQAGGASKGLLSNVAAAGPGGALGQALFEGGPEAIALANKTLAGLQEIAGSTSKGLTNDYFGSKIDQLKDRVDRLGDRFEHVVGRIENHYHDIVVDGDRLARAVRSHAQQGATRNGGSTGFA